MSGKSFFQITLESLGLTAETNSFKVKPVKAGVPETDSPVDIVNPIFEEDKNGNVVIHYYQLTGAHYNYRSDDNRNVQNFKRTRLKTPIKPENGDEIKYLSPKGSGMFPYFPERIIRKYLAKEKIETLIVTEGEKKALKACMSGFDCIGIPSIHGFYAGDVKGRIHDDIQELILVCQVEKIIYLTDADTMVIRWEKGKDLYKRPNTFYTAVKLFREGLQLLLDDKEVTLENVYFAYIQDKHLYDGKGLDDLLISYPALHDDIKADLLQYQFARKYFNCYIITDGKTDKIYRYFGLNNEKTFYDQYKKYIGANEFLYRGRTFEYDGENVKYVRHEDTDKYMRVGADWLKIISIPNKHGETMEEIIPYKITEINRDYSRYKDFIDHIPKYDAFFNLPCWNDDYKRVLYNCYNLTAPLTHRPEAGEFPATYKFLKHVFSGQGVYRNGLECGDLGDVFTVAMDWLTIIFRYPKQMVPVPILVSKEYRTGKSTFLKWLAAVFRGNTAILNNEQFKMQFNSHYITKYIIAIDEGFLDVDKKQEKERLKQLATSDTAYLQLKGINMKPFPYYGKLIICSNDADNVMRLDDKESRWFVVKVPSLPAEDVDPDLESKMIAEIPAFLHYLTHREIFHPRQDRLWFKPQYFITEQFNEIVKHTRSSFEKEFCEMMEEMFKVYKMNTILLDLPWLHANINKELKYKVNKTDIKKFLKEKKGMNPADDPVRFKVPIGFTNMPNSDSTDIEYSTHVGRVYTFHREDWLHTDDAQLTIELKSNDDQPF